MEKLRGDLIVFDPRAETWLPVTGNDHVLGFGRYFQGEKMIALFNFSDEPQVAWMVHDQESFISLTDGEIYDTGAVELPAGGFRWLLHRFTDRSET